MFKGITRAAVLALAFAMVGTAAHAQSFRDRLKQKVKDAVSAQEDTIASTIVDSTVTRTKRVVHCVVDDKKCVQKAQAAGQTVVLTNGQGQVLPPAQQPTPAAAAAAQTSVAAPASAPMANSPSPDATAPEAVALINYDFVPGDKVLFAEDFSNDKVGDIPSRIKIASGNFEVSDFQGQRFLRSTSGGKIMIPLRGPLPDKFTLEFDAIHSWGWSTDVHFVDGDHSDGHGYATFGGSSGIGEFTSNPAVDKSDQVYHARIMADGEHVKVYVDGKRVANVPEGKLGRANAIWIDGQGSDSQPFYITNIRLAESQKSLFDALSANGRVATHGILFDTNSDRIRAESAPTLQEIGSMLQQHADLKLLIEGHTDNVGQSAANLSLSQRRADAVKQYLTGTLHIDAARLQTKGYGDTKPASPNATAEGRQQNRRVELVRVS